MSNPRFAITGEREPLFSTPLPVGQFYNPNRSQFGEIAREVFDSGWFTNHGPKAQLFEGELERYLNVRNAVLCTNATIGLTMALETLPKKGEVIIPDFTFVATALAVKWSGHTPRVVDVNNSTHMLEMNQVEEAINGNTVAILAVNLWGNLSNYSELNNIAEEHGIRLIFDSCHAFGVEHNLSIYANEIIEVYSLHATKMLSSAEGGIIATNSDEIAETLRNIRSSYGARKQIRVTRTSNGRFSELQAALGHFNLGRIQEYRAHNRLISQVYTEELQAVPGIHILPVATKSNHSYFVVEIDEEEFGLDRDLLLKLLSYEKVVARRYFYPGITKTLGFKELALQSSHSGNTISETIGKRILQLPIGSRVSEQDASKIAQFIVSARNYSGIDWKIL